MTIYSRGGAGDGSSEKGFIKRIVGRIRNEKIRCRSADGTGRDGTRWERGGRSAGLCHVSVSKLAIGPHSDVSSSSTRRQRFSIGADWKRGGAIVERFVLGEQSFLSFNQAYHSTWARFLSNDHTTTFTAII